MASFDKLLQAQNEFERWKMKSFIAGANMFTWKLWKQ